jgi:iron complex transport system substrate-binding protein
MHRIRSALMGWFRETTRHRLLARAASSFAEISRAEAAAAFRVSELIAIAGGVNIFPELAGCKSAKDRITTPEAVIARAPDIIIGSWCGKKFSKDRVAARPGFDTIPAVRNRKLYEIKSALILQPGPAALTDGLMALENIILGAQ